MRNEVTVPKQQISALELLALCGCGFFFAWMLCTFYWLMPVATDASGSGPDAAWRDLVQLFVFVGLAAGYLIQWGLAKSSAFRPYRPAVLAFDVVCMAAVPVLAFGLAAGIPVPSAVQSAACFLAGLGGAFVTVGWLDAPSLFCCERLARFYSLGVLGGCVLFAAVAFLPLAAQTAFCAAFAALSVGLLCFVSSRDEVRQRPRAEGSPVDTWTRQNVREVEPSLVAFNIVFGVNFCMLSGYGLSLLFLGLMGAAVGALFVYAFDHFGIETNIVVFQRIVLVASVVACVVFPFAPVAAKPFCGCCLVASWAAFLSVNYEHMVKKSMLKYDVPVFRQLPQRLIFAGSGFAAGWALATGFVMLYGFDADEAVFLFLGLVVMLVLVVMVFFPADNHHLKAKAGQSDAEKPPVIVMTEGEAFQNRIDAIARQFKLSAREKEVFALLASGRNMAYIQEKLVLSPYTVKTHAYHIYGKLDIHSQQKVIDFVESYVVDPAEPAANGKDSVKG